MSTRAYCKHYDFIPSREDTSKRTLASLDDMLYYLEDTVFGTLTLLSGKITIVL
jgi:hypothetical protein